MTKSKWSNLLLIATCLIWVIGVDSMPFMKVLGFSMFCLAASNWVRHSTWFKAWSQFISDGMRGKFDYYED